MGSNPTTGSSLTGKVGIKEVTFSSLYFCGDKNADLGWRGLDGPATRGGAGVVGVMSYGCFAGWVFWEWQDTGVDWKSIIL